LALGLGTIAAMTDIGRRESVPAANDNGTAVVGLLALARLFLSEPPAGIRVILLSAGSEESFSEGIKAFGERHFEALPKESTFFLCLETLGATHLLALQGEGFLKMRDYPPRALAFVEGVAEDLGIWLYPNLRTYNGTDALEPRVAGYETVALCSCTDQKQPGRYHWPNDVTANVNFETLERAILLSQEAVRRLSQSWL
jgi:Zn-dependent M28 family amino/carboxypeptidase